MALTAWKNREQGFDCRLWKGRTRHRRIARDVGARRVLRRWCFASERRSFCKLVHCLLLQALGLELDRLDLGTKELGRRGSNKRRRRFERAPDGAERNHGCIPPGSDAPFELLDLGRRNRPLEGGVPQQKQKEIDI